MKSRITDGKLHNYISKILIQRPDLRDSDSRLITHIWYHEVKEKGHNIDKMSAVEFLKLLQGNILTSTESIRRGRQKVQELVPETRGKKYKQRHSKSKEVRDFYSKGTF